MGAGFASENEWIDHKLENNRASAAPRLENNKSIRKDAGRLSYVQLLLSRALMPSPSLTFAKDSLRDLDANIEIPST